MPQKTGEKSSHTENRDTQRITTTFDLELFDYIPTSRLEQKKNRFTEKLNKIFEVFYRPPNVEEHQQTVEGSISPKVIDVRDVGTIVRSAGLNPSNADVLEIIEEVEGPESTGVVSSDALTTVLLRILMTNEFKGKIMLPESEERIYRAFVALDKKGEGFLDGNYLREVMMSFGERFTADEADEMIRAAADPSTGNVYYEEFASLMAAVD